MLRGGRGWEGLEPRLGSGPRHDVVPQSGRLQDVPSGLQLPPYLLSSLSSVARLCLRVVQTQMAHRAQNSCGSPWTPARRKLGLCCGGVVCVCVYFKQQKQLLKQNFEAEAHGGYGDTGVEQPSREGEGALQPRPYPGPPGSGLFCVLDPGPQSAPVLAPALAVRGPGRRYSLHWAPRMAVPL